MTARPTIFARLRRLNPWRFKGMIRPNLRKAEFWMHSQHLLQMHRYLLARELVSASRGRKVWLEMKREYRKAFLEYRHRKRHPL